MNDENKRIICWFSCGAASAVATKLVLQEHPDALVVYSDTGSEHPDNKRFIKDCEEWFGKEVIRIKSEKFSNIWEVFEKTRYLVGPSGARCTSELKRIPAEGFINFLKDVEVMGYTVEEKSRVERFIKDNNERKLWPILVERGLTKQDCLAILQKQGIELPVMYRQGFSNNNCIGCVKGGAKYWKRIRNFYPEEFQKMSEVEQNLGIAILRKQKTLTTEQVSEILSKDIDSVTIRGDKSLLDQSTLDELLIEPYVGLCFVVGGSTYRFTNKGKWDNRNKVFLKDLPDDISEFPKVKTIQCGSLCTQVTEDFDQEFEY